jgi:hypothetical protein
MPLYYVSRNRTVMADGGPVRQGDQIALDRAEGERLMAAGFVQTSPPSIGPVNIVPAIGRDHIGFVPNGHR